MSKWWAWDLYPLAPGTWPNECVTLEGVQPGHPFTHTHTHVEQRRVPFLGDARGWYEGETEQVLITTRRDFYRPTEEDFMLIRTSLPTTDAENPSWPAVQAELVAGGKQSHALSNEKAPTLIRFLRNLTSQGNGRRRAVAKGTTARARRRKLPKAIETAVLTQSARRCCLCFALQDDHTVKDGQIAHLDDDPSNNDPDNLAWLCLDHHAKWHARSTMTKGFTAEEVKAHRERLYRAVKDNALGDDGEALPRNIPLPVTFQTKTGDKSTVINAAGPVNYNVRGRRKPPTVKPPPDAIGSSIEMRSYIEYLTKRYIDWRKKGIDDGVDKRRFHPSMVHQLVAKHFGARTPLVPQARFDDLVEFLQKAIDNTIWGRKNRNRNYHSFDEHRAQVRGRSQDQP